MAVEIECVGAVLCGAWDQRPGAVLLVGGSVIAAHDQWGRSGPAGAADELHAGGVKEEVLILPVRGGLDLRIDLLEGEAHIVGDLAGELVALYGDRLGSQGGLTRILRRLVGQCIFAVGHDDVGPVRLKGLGQGPIVRSGESLVHRVCNDLVPCGVGVNIIREIRCHACGGSVDIDELAAGLLGSLLLQRGDLPVHGGRDDIKRAVVVGGGAGSQIDLRLGLQILVLGNQRLEIGEELILFGPVGGLGVVGAQHQDHDIGLVVFALGVDVLVPIGHIAVFHHGGATAAIVFHLIAAAELIAQQGRPVVGGEMGLSSVGGGVVAIGDAVAHTGHLDGGLGCTGRAGQKAQAQHEAEQQGQNALHGSHCVLLS